MASYLDFVKVHGRAGKRSRGLIIAGTTVIACALGRGGTTLSKREGDGATPIGEFPLRRLYFRPDRAAPPLTGLAVRRIDPTLGWSDDPADPLYNRAVRLPRDRRHERMWREDGIYDYVVVIGHNDDPPLKPMGSAIFLHLARPGFLPTEGCVAVSRHDMQRLLPRLGPRTRIIISR